MSNFFTFSLCHAKPGYVPLEDKAISLYGDTYAFCEEYGRPKSDKVIFTAAIADPWITKSKFCDWVVNTAAHDKYCSSPKSTFSCPPKCAGIKEYTGELRVALSVDLADMVQAEPWLLEKSYKYITNLKPDTPLCIGTAQTCKDIMPESTQASNAVYCKPNRCAIDNHIKNLMWNGYGYAKNDYSTKLYRARGLLYSLVNRSDRGYDTPALSILSNGHIIGKMNGELGRYFKHNKSDIKNFQLQSTVLKKSILEPVLSSDPDKADIKFVADLWPSYTQSVTLQSSLVVLGDKNGKPIFDVTGSINSNITDNSGFPSIQTTIDTDNEDLEWKIISRLNTTVPYYNSSTKKIVFGEKPTLIETTQDLTFDFDFSKQKQIDGAGCSFSISVDDILNPFNLKASAVTDTLSKYLPSQLKNGPRAPFYFKYSIEFNKGVYL